MSSSIALGGLAVSGWGMLMWQAVTRCPPTRTKLPKTRRRALLLPAASWEVAADDEVWFGVKRVLANREL